MQTESLPLPEVNEITGVDLWKSELFGAVNNPATFEQLWNSVPTPKRDCVVYDWPENAK